MIFIEIGNYFWNILIIYNLLLSKLKLIVIQFNSNKHREIFESQFRLSGLNSEYKY